MSKIIKVCITGTHGVGKTWIVDRVWAKLSEVNPGFVGIVKSSTRDVKKLGFEINESTSWETQLLSGSNRVQAQRRLLNHALNGQRDHVILGDRCLLDELAYNKIALEKFARKSAQSSFSGFWNLVQTDDLLAEFWKDDKENYWDRVYYKPLNPDYPPESDGDRSPDVEYQKKVQESLVGLFNKYDVRAIELPMNREECTDIIVNDILKFLSCKS